MFRAATAFTWLLGQLTGASAGGVTAADERQFVDHVLPVLPAKCWACHGNEPQKLKGDLDLRPRAGLLQGGASGQPALVAGQPLASPLWLSASRAHADWSAMPPKANDQLSAEQLAALKTWIAAGAPWPSAERIAELKKLAAPAPAVGIVVATSGGLAPEWTERRYAPADVWAFRAPARSTTAQSINGFINQRWAQLQLAPAPLADRHTLLRRLTFALLGLPPTLAELTDMEVPKIARQRFLDDVTDAVGQTFLGQPLQCARCHDHKFDPIPTKDYYSIQAVFATLQIADRPAPFLASEAQAGFDERRYLERWRAHFVAEQAQLKQAEAAAKTQWLRDHPEAPAGQAQREKYLPPAHLGRERIARKELERLAWRLDRYEPIALAVYNGHTPDVKAVYAPPRLPANLLKGELHDRPAHAVELPGAHKNKPDRTRGRRRKHG
jgi:mono/diheme cytochrome c family protein